MSEFFPWDDMLYSVGIASIDAQHKKLVALVNNLFEAMKSGKGATVVGSILDELIQYTASHFKYAEECMENVSIQHY